MILLELFNTVAPVKWGAYRPGLGLTGTFEVGGVPYFFHFAETHDRGFEFAFSVSKAFASKQGIKDPYGNTGLNGQASIAVFSTAIDILLTFIKNRKPRYVDFIGKDEYGKGDLYSRIMKKVASRFEAIGYGVNETRIDGLGQVEFRLKRKAPVISKPTFEPK
jgi:hypothetical protein